MKDKILKDENFFWKRMDFAKYLVLHRVVSICEQNNISDNSEFVKKHKKSIQSAEQGYLNYRDYIENKFCRSGVETVLAIAFSPELVHNKIFTGGTGPSIFVSPASAIDDECVGVCARLAKWEYEAWHFKRIRWVAYITAFVLSASGIIAFISLLSKWVPLGMS